MKMTATEAPCTLSQAGVDYKIEEPSKNSKRFVKAAAVVTGLGLYAAIMMGRGEARDAGSSFGATAVETNGNIDAIYATQLGGTCLAGTIYGNPDFQIRHDSDDTVAVEPLLGDEGTPSLVFTEEQGVLIPANSFTQEFIDDNRC